jgi:hypothetical protein
MLLPHLRQGEGSFWQGQKQHLASHEVPHSSALGPLFFPSTLQIIREFGNERKADGPFELKMTLNHAI